MKPLFVLIPSLLALNSLNAQITISVSTDKTVYRNGDTLHVIVKATNNGSAPDTLFFGSCLTADYLLDSLDWAYGLYWCQHTSESVVPAYSSISWGGGYFFSSPYIAGSSPLGTGKHSVVGKVRGYGFSDTLWIEVTLVTDISDPGGVPREYSLENNYPNPFNPSTTIRYGLPQSSEVTLTVYNALGQRIALLAQGAEDAGYHEVRFDGANLASGLYFYRLEAGGFVRTMRSMLLK